MSSPSSSRHVIVIGAGAAGLTAALRAAQAGARVTLLNAHPRVGLKILMSGGTRCNVTHAKVSERDFHGGSPNVIRRVLSAFTVPQTLDWFRTELGVALKLEDTGKYFPESDDAQTVLDALLIACEQAGVTLVKGARAVRLERSGAGGEMSAGGGSGASDRWRVGVQPVQGSAEFGEGHARAGETAFALPDVPPAEWYEADAVVLATGGLSFPRTGSDGTGYALATALGHTLVPTMPALTPLVAVDPLCRSAQGVTIDAELALWVDGRVAERVRGSLLFAHFGVTGPAALDLSRHFAAAEGRSRRVTLSFMPGETIPQLDQIWVDYGEMNPRRGVRTWIGHHLPERIADVLTIESGLGGAAMSQVPRERRTQMLRALTERDIGVTGTLGYEKAEVTAGGVALNEVDASTLESRKAPGLWLCGEVLDVEGRLGGFNFQWSWSSGTVAGRAAALK
ncbi:MAG: aminoacetone oxidase family FAD-binding enzyme [Candidatus Eisenbacteria bacterium]